MTSLNKTQLIGNLGRDPEVRYSADGKAIANISIATTEVWKDKTTGEKKEATEWHRVVFFNRLAEIVGEYLKKGSQVYVEGQLRTRKWTDREGHDKYTTEIIASEMKMLGSRNMPTSQSYQAPAESPASSSSVSSASSEKSGLPSDDFHDDVPF